MGTSANIFRADPTPSATELKGSAVNDANS